MYKHFYQFSLEETQSVLDCPGAIVSKFSGCQARTSPQQNWQELSKLQESLAGGRGWAGGLGPVLDCWGSVPLTVGRWHTLSMTTSQATALSALCTIPSLSAKF